MTKILFVCHGNRRKKQIFSYQILITVNHQLNYINFTHSFFHAVKIYLIKNISTYFKKGASRCPSAIVILW